MKNDELKALYEEFPWAWDVQWKNYGPEQDWHTTYNIGWLFPAKRVPVRLKPRLPADLPEPTEGMYNRAVYLGQGRVSRPERVEGFKGWVHRVHGWSEVPYVGGVDFFAHYCIDINDPNAREIIALNREHDPFDDLRASGGLVEAGLAGGQEHTLAELVTLVRDRVEQDMRGEGWTPPGESQWLRLDECEFEVRTPSGWFPVEDSYSVDEWAAIEIIREGPASVRVRIAQQREAELVEAIEHAIEFDLGWSKRADNPGFVAIREKLKKPSLNTNRRSHEMPAR